MNGMARPQRRRRLQPVTGRDFWVREGAETRVKVGRSQQRIGGRGSQVHGDVLQCHALTLIHTCGNFRGCESGLIFKRRTRSLLTSRERVRRQR